MKNDAINFMGEEGHLIMIIIFSKYQYKKNILKTFKVNREMEAGVWL